jgi:hypothetical protein
LERWVRKIVTPQHTIFSYLCTPFPILRITLASKGRGEKPLVFLIVALSSYVRSCVRTYSAADIL